MGAIFKNGILTKFNDKLVKGQLSILQINTTVLLRHYTERYRFSTIFLDRRANAKRR